MKKPAGIISGSITVLFRIEVGMIILLFLGLAFFPIRVRMITVSPIGAPRTDSGRLK